MNWTLDFFDWWWFESRLKKWEFFIPSADDCRGLPCLSVAIIPRVLGLVAVAVVADVIGRALVESVESEGAALVSLAALIAVALSFLAV